MCRRAEIRLDDLASVAVEETPRPRRRLRDWQPAPSQGKRPGSKKSDLLRLPFAAGYGSVILFPAAPLASS
jgi:hypothetical protein